MDRMKESSSDLIDYRSRLIYVNIRLRHPSWNPTIVRAIAFNKSIFVSIFQAPLEFFGRIRMKVLLLFMKLKHTKRNGADTARG